MDDKLIHVLVSFVLVVLFRICINPISVSNNIIYFCVISIGLIKEIIDISKGGDLKESILDMLANLIGMTVGMILID